MAADTPQRYQTPFCEAVCCPSYRLVEKLAFSRSYPFLMSFGWSAGDIVVAIQLLVKAAAALCELDGPAADTTKRMHICFPWRRSFKD
jgi:hypothetical protein